MCAHCSAGCFRVVRRARAQPGARRARVRPPRAWNSRGPSAAARVQMALPPSAATVLATFPPLLSLHCLSVTPVVASISAACAARLVPAPAEVAAVFTVPLRHFLERHERHTWHEASYGAFTCRIHHFAHGRWDVWGLTAAILIQVAQAALGRAAEFDVHGPHIDYAHLYSADGREVCLRARRSARLAGR